MKKLYYFGAIAGASIAALCLPALVAAHNGIDDGDEQSIGVRFLAQASVSPSSNSGQGNIQEKIRADIENRMKNAKNNQDFRNNVLENKKMMAASGTPPRPQMMSINKERRGDGDDDNDDRFDDHRGPMMWNASSTTASSTRLEMLRDLMKQREEHRKDVRADVFKLQKMHIVAELNHALSNLKQVRERLSSRIQKAEQSGRNMTEAKNLLVIADSKILAADQAIKIVDSLNIAATSTASTTVDLTKPRQYAQNAIKALKEAKKSLNDVVVSIAHNMGLKLGQRDNDNATTTPSVSPSTSPSPTASSTASTTTTI